MKQFGIFLIALLACLSVSAQTDKNKPQTDSPGTIKSSPAYAEILLRKTELQADLEVLVASYTESNPKILDLRAEIASLDKSLEKVFSIRPSETGKLTLALGKLIVKKAALDLDLARLLRSKTPDQVEVKRATRRSEIFQAAIDDILR